MDWGNRKTFVKTITIKDSIGYNVAKRLGAPETPNSRHQTYVIEVVSADNNEFLYRVLMEPDGTWKRSKMFYDAWETPNVIKLRDTLSSIMMRGYFFLVFIAHL